MLSKLDQGTAFVIRHRVNKNFLRPKSEKSLSVFWSLPSLFFNVCALSEEMQLALSSLVRVVFYTLFETTLSWDGKVVGRQNKTKDLEQVA